MVKKRERDAENDKIFSEEYQKTAKKFNEIFGKYDTRNLGVTDEKTKQACFICKKEKVSSHFVKTRNPFFKNHRTPMCKSCLADSIDFENFIEIQYVLTMLYLPFVPDLWEKCVDDKPDNPFGTYAQRIGLPCYQTFEPGPVFRFKEVLKKFDENPYQARLEMLPPTETRELKKIWGEGFALVDCLKMQDYYQEMKLDFNIENRGHDDYLRKIIRTSFSADKQLEEGNMGEYQKMIKVYNDLMKAAEFSAASKKDKKKDGELNSVALLYEMCERKGFIPEYHNEEAPDIVDTTEKNLKLWMYKLISNESDLSILLENAAKRVAEQEKKDAKLNEYAEIEELDDGL